MGMRREGVPGCREEQGRTDRIRIRFSQAFCHIPLSDPDPAAKAGDLAPADTAPVSGKTMPHGKMRLHRLFKAHD